MKAQNFDDLPPLEVHQLADGTVEVAMHVDLWDYLVGRLRNLQFVKGYCLTVKDGAPALGFVLDGGEIICAIKRPVSGLEKGLN
jgi:hypothetical protein